MGIITFLFVVALVLILIPPSIFVADIQRTGFRTWLREGGRQPGLKWFGWYFPRGLKTLGPLLYLLLIALCLFLVYWLRRSPSGSISLPPGKAYPVLRSSSSQLIATF